MSRRTFIHFILKIPLDRQFKHWNIASKPLAYRSNVWNILQKNPTFFFSIFPIRNIPLYDNLENWWKRSLTRLSSRSERGRRISNILGIVVRSDFLSPPPEIEFKFSQFFPGLPFVSSVYEISNILFTHFWLLLFFFFSILHSVRARAQTYTVFLFERFTGVP